MWKLQSTFACEAEFFETNYSLFEICKFGINFGLWRRVIFFNKHSFKLIFHYVQQSFGLATKILRQSCENLLNVWVCRKIFWIKLQFFENKSWTQTHFRTLSQKVRTFLAEMLHQDCQNCVKHVRRNFFRKLNVFLRNNCAFSFFRGFWQKSLGRVVENAFCVSNGTLWGFFQKIVTLNLLFLRRTKSDYWQISCGRVVKTAFDFCRGKFGWTIHSLDKDILKFTFGFSRKIFRFWRKSHWKGAQLYDYLPTCPENLFDRVFVNIIFSCFIIRLWAKLSWTSVRKFR